MVEAVTYSNDDVIVSITDNSGDPQCIEEAVERCMFALGYTDVRVVFDDSKTER